MTSTVWSRLWIFQYIYPTHMSAGTAKDGVLPWPDVLRSGCTTGGVETPCACGCTRNRGRTT